MGRVAILFEKLDKRSEAERKCRDCSLCADRNESHGMCLHLLKRVAYTNPANKCDFFHAAKLREGSATDARYGQLKSSMAVARVRK